MKKWISLLFVAALVLFANVHWTSAAAKQTPVAKQTTVAKQTPVAKPISDVKQTPAAPVPKLYLDGKVLTANVPPALVHASVMVPIRTVAENLGYKVGWDDKKKQVTVEQGATKILMTLNDPKATVNGKTVSLVEPPLLQTGTTLIPIRFVSEAFGIQIMWDNTSKSAFLITDGSAGNTGGNGTGGGTGTDAGSKDPATGSETGSGSGNGTQTGSNPADGGWVGEPDGPGSNTGSTGSTGGEGGSDPNGSVIPAAPSFIHQIRYEPDTVIVSYEGTVSPVANVLSGPDRIVIDLPYADYATDFTAGYGNGVTPDYTTVNAGLPSGGQIAELPVIGQETLAKVRYSRYSDSPQTARIVLDMNAPQGFEMSNNAAYGELRIHLKQSDLPSQPAKGVYTIVLDAGHGGTDPGARSITGKWEKDFNLSVVKKAQALLSGESKINLVLTRQGDTYPTLDDRVNLANSLNADLFLSVHANAYTAATNGTETYYLRANSQDFAKLLHKNAVAATGFKDNGVRTANYKVIRETTMPAVLLEVGYLTNASNEKQLYDDAFQNRVAAAIANSMKQYFNLS